MKAFLFPGQGSQSVGMLAGFAADAPVVEETFAEASKVLGYDLWAICRDGPAERLNRTEVTQPAMLAGDIVTWRVWLAEGGAQPEFMAGHSLGEYAALVASGALAFSDGIHLVRERGRLMQEATPEGTGGMAAVLGLDDAELVRICAAEAGDQVVSCANFNAPGQVVIAGHREAVERACLAATEAGARKAVTLPVSVPSHCVLMRDAADQLAEMLDEIAISTPGVAVLQNADAAAFSEPRDIRAALIRQLWQPVQWTRTIRRLLEAGVGQFAECGPGKVLAGLNRRIAREAQTIVLDSPEAIQMAIRGEA